MIHREARLANLVAPGSRLEDVHAAMNAGMPVAGRQVQSHQTALTLAFPLMSYMRAMSQYCREHEIRRVYFLSREGLFFKRIFDVMDQSGLKTHYLCVSRMSLFMLTLEELDELAVDRMLDLFEHHSHLPKVSIRQLLCILKIDDREVFRIVRHLGHDVHRPMPFKENREAFKSVLLDHRIGLCFARKRSDYLGLFERYLRSSRLPSAERVLLCDMGWSGSMQTYLAGVLQELGCSVQLHGFYFGYDKTIDAKKHPASAINTIKTGYYVYDGSPEHIREQQIINNISLEIMASAEHGTVVSYRDKQGCVSPVFKHVPEEIWQHRRFIRPFQDLIVNYAQRYQSLFDEMARVYAESELYAYNLRITHALFYDLSPEFRRFLAFIFHDDFFGRNVRILIAPYMPSCWRRRIRFGVRGVACGVARLLVPPGLLGRLAGVEVGTICRRNGDSAYVDTTRLTL